MRKLAIYPEDYRMPVEGATGLAYDEGCQRCPLSFGVDSVCMPAQGDPGGILIVLDSPSSDDDRAGSLARGREDRAVARAWEDEARAVIKLRDKVARRRR